MDYLEIRIRALVADFLEDKQSKQPCNLVKLHQLQEVCLAELPTQQINLKIIKVDSSEANSNNNLLQASLVATNPSSSNNPPPKVVFLEFPNSSLSKMV